MGDRQVLFKQTPKGHISIPDLVLRWDVSPTTTRRWVRENSTDLPTRRFNGKRRCVLLKSVVAFERAHGVPLQASS